MMLRKRERRVADALLAADAPVFGYDLSRRAKVRSGAMYRFLDRALAAGWLGDGWEGQPSLRRRRRFYVLTELGKRELAVATPMSGVLRHAEAWKETRANDDVFCPPGGICGQVLDVDENGKTSWVDPKPVAFQAAYFASNAVRLGGDGMTAEALLAVADVLERWYVDGIPPRPRTVNDPGDEHFIADLRAWAADLARSSSGE